MQNKSALVYMIVTHLWFEVKIFDVHFLLVWTIHWTNGRVADDFYAPWLLLDVPVTNKA